MKNKIVGIFIVMLFIGTIFTVINSVTGCTGFTASDDENVLVGSNEDWYIPFYNARFFPAENNNYGYFALEYSWPLPWVPNWNTTIFGLNDQGLFCDSFSAPYLEILNNGKKLPIFLDNHYIYDIRAYCLSVCSTIQEVIDIYSQYNLKIAQVETGQHLYVDLSGDSIIIEGDEIIYKAGDFQVVTNFYQSNPDLGWETSFWRYNTAISMLENMTELSVEYFVDICNATHQEGNYYPTILSQVCDLKNGIIYLYDFHNYDNKLIIDLHKELENGKQVWYNVPSIFEPINNQPPNKPNPPFGEISGNVKTEYIYKVDYVLDSDNSKDEIYYKFDWGDGSFSPWYNRYWIQGGLINHSWKKQGTYSVRVQAKDIYGAESEWSDPLSVTMPKTKAFSIPLFLHRLFQRFPFFEKILK